MKKSPAKRHWETIRQLPPELDLPSVNKMIASFPPEPPPRSWTDFLTPKTKWIMSISLFVAMAYLYVMAIPSPDLQASARTTEENMPVVFDVSAARVAIEEENLELSQSSASQFEINEVAAEPRQMSLKSQPASILSVPSLVPPEMTTGQSSSEDLMFDAVDMLPSEGPHRAPSPNLATSSDKTSNTPGFRQQQDPEYDPINSDQVPKIASSGELVHEGNWALEFAEDNRPQIRYRWREKGKGWKANWSVVQPITDGELQRISQPQVRSNQIGRVYLEPKGKKKSGSFTFYLDSENAEKLSSLGANPERVQERTRARTTKEMLLIGLPDLFASSDFGAMWFRYFALGVDNEYLQLLLDYGTSTEEFYDFWMLAQQGISHDQLAAGLKLLPKISYERLDLESLSRVLNYSHATEKLAFYAANGYRNKTAEEVEYLVGVSGVKGYAKVLADLGYENVDHALLGELRSSFITEEMLQELAPEAANVEALVQLAVAKKRDAALLSFQPMIFGGSSPYAWGTSCTEPALYTQALPSFTKAVIRGNIRVVIRKGDVNQMTTIALPGKEKLVMVVEKDGVLTISAPKGPDRTFNYDIQLTAKDLTQLKVKTKGCVWLDGTEAQQTIKGDGCPTRNFQGKWIEVQKANE